jgi:hypothetical protein
MEEENTSSSVQSKQEAHNISNSTATRSLGLGCLKNDTQVAYRAQIRRSTHVWKAYEIRFPIPLVPHHY